MAQQIDWTEEGRIELLDLPDPEWVLPGIKWGAFERPLTPAFWASQAWMNGRPEQSSFRQNADLETNSTVYWAYMEPRQKSV